MPYSFFISFYTDNTQRFLTSTVLPACRALLHVAEVHKLEPGTVVSRVMYQTPQERVFVCMVDKNVASSADANVTAMEKNNFVDWLVSQKIVSYDKVW